MLRHLPVEFKKISGNFGWLSLEQMVRLVSGAVVGALVARYLGPDNFGLYNLAITVISFGLLISQLGIAPIVLRELSKTEVGDSGILGTVFVLQMATAILGVVACYGFTKAMWPNDTGAVNLVLLMSAAVLLQPFQNLERWFQARYLSKFTVISRMAGIGATIFLRLYLIYARAPIEAFGLSVVAESFFTALSLAWAYRNRGGLFSRWRFESAIALEFLREAVPMMSSALAIALQARLDVFLIEKFVGFHALGLYISALKIIEIATAPSVLMAISVSPLIARRRQEGDGSFYDALSASYKLIAILTLSMAVPIMLLAGPIIHILYGAAYAGSVPLLMLLTPRIVIGGIGTARGNFIINSGNLFLAPLSAAIGAAINLALGIVLIPRLGAEGAIYTSLISLSVTTFVIDSCWKRTRRNLNCMLSSLAQPWKFRPSDM